MVKGIGLAAFGALGIAAIGATPAAAQDAASDGPVLSGVMDVQVKNNYVTPRGVVVTSKGAELNNNPSPGNKTGGLTTILEKSLGAVAKAGTSPLMDVIGYGEPVRRSGLTFMDSPGYDPCSATGQVASGANIIAFTTGRGSAFGCKPSPSIKIASNSDMAARMSGDMDIDCGPIATGEATIEEMGERILDYLLDIASGRPSKSEALGYGGSEFVPWIIGATV